MWTDEDVPINIVCMDLCAGKVRVMHGRRLISTHLLFQVVGYHPLRMLDPLNLYTMKEDGRVRDSILCLGLQIADNGRFDASPSRIRTR